MGTTLGQERFQFFTRCFDLLKRKLPRDDYEDPQRSEWNNWQHICNPTNEKIHFEWKFERSDFTVNLFFETNDNNRNRELLDKFRPMKQRLAARLGVTPEYKDNWKRNGGTSTWTGLRVSRPTKEITPELEKWAVEKAIILIEECEPILLGRTRPPQGVAAVNQAQLIEAAIEDVAQGGLHGAKFLASSGRKLTWERLELARQCASEVGRQGEELIDRHFARELRHGRIDSYEWVSNDKATSPFDFTFSQANKDYKLDVKATSHGFSQPLHISMKELLEMQNCDERYDLYRVYDMNTNRGRLRIAEDVREFAGEVLKAMKAMEDLPYGVAVDSISVEPDTIKFGKEIVLPVD